MLYDWCVCLDREGRGWGIVKKGRGVNVGRESGRSGRSGRGPERTVCGSKMLLLLLVNPPVKGKGRGRSGVGGGGKERPISTARHKSGRESERGRGFGCGSPAQWDAVKVGRWAG